MNRYSYKLSDNYRVIFVLFLLATFAGSLFITRSVVTQSEAAPVSASTASPSALGRLAYEQLAFTQAGGRTSLRGVNADGTNFSTLCAAGVPPLHCAEPAYSPDGARLAFNQDNDIYVMNADGSNRVNLTGNNLSIIESNPSWSATGKIAYERAGQIWTMNADGSNQAQFAAITQPSPIRPAWSPDGSKMAFASGGEIWVINADGSGERRVTNNSSVDADPAWSPDGAKPIFGKGASGIATINLDGTNETNLTTNALDGKPAWSPDGTKIAFVRRTGDTGGIFTMDANGANQARVVADRTTQPDRNENDNPAWQPVRQLRTSFDFDGDGRADVAVFRPSNGFWYFLNSNGGFTGRQFGVVNDVIAPADFDGDGKTDIAVFRPVVAGAGNQSYFYILNSADDSFRAAGFGTSGDVPVVGNWDNDGKADLAVYRGASASGGQGFFYYRPSAQPTVGLVTIPLGSQGDKPIVGDFDGDGKTDAAVWQSSTATWTVAQSSNSQTVQTNFGIATDVPAPADFDGDGKTNIAVYRPSNGTWYTSNNPATNYGAIVFGTSGDLPVPADYDGDGRADAAVYRPSSGIWYVNRTTSGLFGVQFGAGGDKPAPNAFVP